MPTGDEITSGRTTTENLLSAPTVTRVFQDGEGVFTIPELGDFHPDLLTLQVVTREITQFEDHPTQQLYTVNYERVDVDFTTTTPTASELLPRRLQIGSSFIVIDKKTGIFWDSDGEETKQPIGTRLGTATLHITQIRTTQNFTGIIEKAGKLNSVAFEDQARGVWLYVGADMEEFRDKDGDRLWRADHTFAFQRVTFDVGADLDGWDWFLREQAAGGVPVFDRARRGTGLLDLYQYAAFEPLLTSKSA